MWTSFRQAARDVGEWMGFETLLAANKRFEDDLKNGASPEKIEEDKARADAARLNLLALNPANAPLVLAF